MSQNSIQLPTSGTLGGLQGINDINAALDTLNTKWAGATAPAAAEFGQSWIDTSTTPNSLKIYDGTQWVAIAWIDTVNHLWQPTASGGLVSVGSITLDHSHVGKLLTNSSATGVTTSFPLAASLLPGQRLRFVQQYNGGAWTLARSGSDTLQGADGWGAESLTLSELGAYAEFETDGAGKWLQVGKVVPFASVTTTQVGTDAGSIVTPAGLTATILGSSMQSWQNMNGSRSVGTTYTNSTGRPIFVATSVSTGPNTGIGIYVNGNEIGQCSNQGTATSTFFLSFIVLSNETYLVSATSGSATEWWELR